MTAAPANSSPNDGLHRFHQRHVSVTFNEKGREVTIEGLVVMHSHAGIIVKGRGVTTIVAADKIVGEPQILKPRKKRVQRRAVRVFGPEDSVKQHLADRHGVLVSVLDAVDDATARKMHDRINHDDLGHMHMEKGDNRSVVPLEDAVDELDHLGQPVHEVVDLDAFVDEEEDSDDID